VRRGALAAAPGELLGPSSSQHPCRPTGASGPGDAGDLSGSKVLSAAEWLQIRELHSSASGRPAPGTGRVGILGVRMRSRVQAGVQRDRVMLLTEGMFLNFHSHPSHRSGVEIFHWCVRL